MAVVISEDWLSYAEGQIVGEIAGWSSLGFFPNDARGVRVSSTPGILTNTSTNGCVVFQSAGTVNHYSEVEMRPTPTSGTLGAGPAIRVTDLDNFISIEAVNANLIRVFSPTAGELALISGTYSTGDIVRLEAEGDAGRLFVNGAQLGTDFDVSAVPQGSGIGLRSNRRDIDLFGAMEAGTLASNIITVDSINERQIISTIGNSETVTVSGTYSGAVVPSAIEWQLVDAVSNAVVQDWQTLDGSPNSGTFSGDVSIPKGPYRKVKVRFSNDISVEGVSPSFGVGIIIECAGQSNMSNMFTSAALITGVSNNVSLYSLGSGWTAAPASATILYNAMDIISRRENCVVGFFVTAVNGTGIDNYLPAGTYYNERVDKMQEAGGTVNALFWSQGEANTSASGVSTYESKLSELYSDLLTRASKPATDLPFFIVQLGVNNGTGGDEAAWVELRNIQTRFVNDTAGAYISHQAIDLPMFDDLHRTADGYIMETERFADSFTFYTGSNAYSGRGPIPTSITFNGNEVTIKHNLNGSTSLTVPASAGTLYEVSDDDFLTTLTPVSASVNGVDELVLTFGSLPAAPIKVRSHQSMSFAAEDFVDGNLTYNSQAVIAEPIFTARTVDAEVVIQSNFNVVATGIPDGNFKTYLIDSSDTVIYNSSVTFSGGSTTITGLPIAAGVTLEGYVIDNESPHENGAVITGVTV